MPIPEEIKKIAREYARYTCSDISDAQERATDENIEYDFALPILEWLSNNYAIVPKSKLRELQQIVTDNADSLDHGLIDGLSDWVEINLGLQLFEEEK